MSHEEIEQRIKYLVEHGGLYQDPIDELLRQITVLQYTVATLTVAATAAAVGVFLK